MKLNSQAAYFGRGSYPRSCISSSHSFLCFARVATERAPDWLDLLRLISGRLYAHSCSPGLPFSRPVFSIPSFFLSFAVGMPTLCTMALSLNSTACRFASILVWLVTQYVVCVPRPTQVTTWAASLVSLMTGLPDVPTVSEVGNLLPFFFWKKESVPTTLGMGDSLLTFLRSVMLVPSR